MSAWVATWGHQIGAAASTGRGVVLFRVDLEEVPEAVLGNLIALAWRAQGVQLDGRNKEGGVHSKLQLLRQRRHGRNLPNLN